MFLILFGVSVVLEADFKHLQPTLDRVGPSSHHFLTTKRQDGAKERKFKPTWSPRAPTWATKGHKSAPSWVHVGTIFGSFSDLWSYLVFCRFLGGLRCTKHCKTHIKIKKNVKFADAIGLPPSCTSPVLLRSSATSIAAINRNGASRHPPAPLRGTSVLDSDQDRFYQIPEPPPLPPAPPRPAGLQGEIAYLASFCRSFF